MKNTALILWCFGVVGLFTVTANNAKEANRGRQKLISTPPLSGFKSDVLNILTLGQKNLYDDFAYIWILQILADKSLSSENPEVVNAAVQQVTSLRPKIESLYMLACFVMALDLNRPEFCEKISIDGLNAFPESWRIPMTQGFMYAYKLHDPVKASGFYELASSRPESPPYVASLAKKLLNKEPMTSEDAKKALDIMLTVPGGSRFAEFLNKNAKNRAEQNEEKVP